ncbi:MAG: isoleucine--tRNA ligase [Bacilli bacterium]
MDYKETLLMPKTDFEMKGKLPTKEPLIQQRWQDLDLYEKILDSRKDQPYFILHDGPPFANGSIHIGHALNKILKDFIVRSKSLQGYLTPFIPGWDTHGLPIETAITNTGVNRKELSINDFRELCREYALDQIDGQKEQFRRLGGLGEYTKPYITLNKEYEAKQINVFAKMALDGLIYRGLKPVYWSPSSESALAEAEIEYHDVSSPSIYVAFDVCDSLNKIDDDARFVIWTTTPWTIPANVAIALNPKLSYGLYQTSVGKLVLAQDLASQVLETLELEGTLLNSYSGQDLEMILVKHPLYDRESLIINGDHVSADSGTGLVHTAPGHGIDDFNVASKYNLPILCPVDDLGHMKKEAGSFIEGLFYADANKLIGQKLEENKALLKLAFIKHSYPHDWRTKKPIIFRATDQWFASIEMIRPQLLNEIDQVAWTPSWGHDRLYNMIRDRGDWCISRQRVWGVPIPIIYDDKKEPLLIEDVFTHIAALFKEHGSSCWYQLSIKELLPSSYHQLDLSKYTKESDIMDVWFDSGSSHTAVLETAHLPYPADLYLEGSDQYRGWFNSSLITGLAYQNKAPYKQVLSHGFVLDAKGNKMSKSLGNVVDPQKVINQYGADVLRYWVSSVDYQSDVRLSDDMLKQVSDAYRKVRNTFKYCLGNLNDFSETDLVALNELNDVDTYLMIKLNNVLNKCLDAYNKYDFNIVYTSVNNFIIKELSAFYMDYTKDITYILRKDSLRRRQVISVLYHCVNTLNLILAPILVHTAEEVYDFLPMNNRKESVHLEHLDFNFNELNNPVLEAQYDLFMKHRDDVLKELEVARNNKVIGKTLEANLSIYYKEGYEFIASFDNLKQFYIASKVEVLNDPTNLVEYDTCFIKVNKAQGHTCLRCWNVVPEVEVKEELCQRCYEIINN